jgi:GR25 family glycosyltransferase involved in LPS biosynthesis
MYTVNVINLDRDVEKLAEFCAQFCGHEPYLQFQRFKAIDGRQMTGSHSNAVHGLCKAVLCTPGMIGCALSHIELWKRAAAGSAAGEPTIIVEDDARFDAGQLRELLDALVPWVRRRKNTPVFVNMACIGGLCSGRRVKRLRGTDAVLYESTLPLGMAAYIINPAAARLLLDHTGTKVVYHVDLTVATIAAACPLLRLYYIHPSPVVAKNDASTSIGSQHRLSVFLGWSEKMLWYANVPATRFTATYTTILLALIAVTACVAVRYRMYVAYALLGVLVLELVIFTCS